jgi:hypothetical protein
MSNNKQTKRIPNFYRSHEEGAQGSVHLANVGVVQGSIYLVQHEERGGLETDNKKED